MQKQALQVGMVSFQDILDMDVIKTGTPMQLHLH